MSDIAKFTKEIETPNDRVVITHVNVVGAGAKILMSKANLAKVEQTYDDDTKGYNRVVIVLKKPDDSRLKLICSKPVSKGLRDTSINIKMLRTFPIGEYITKDGTAIPQIQMPDGSGFQEVGDVDGEIQDYQVEVTDPQDFIAF